MDVHRSRFVPYPVSPITATAFSRSSDHGLRPDQPQPALKLAIGRQNGDIEIWDPAQRKWLQEAVFPGKDRSVDGLAWTRDPDELDSEGQLILGQNRLFSIASSPAVTEWDLERGVPKKQSTGNFSEVWCFASQPRQEQKKDGEPQFQDIVAGCGDGTIVLLSTADSDLQFKRFVARVPGKKAKCMSIAYQNQHRVIAGFMDSTIRIFDTRNGSNVRSMSLGNGLPGAPKNTIVWQVRSLPNGDIVTGDSNGEVVFWDGRSYSLTQRIQGHRDSECMDLVVSADGKTVLSGSQDGRIAIFRQTTTAGGRLSWAKNQHKKTHEGQIKAMSAFDSKGLSVVVSGGDDLAPVVTPLREFGSEHSRTLPTLPQASPVQSARSARLLVSWWDKSVSIWRLSRRRDGGVDSANSQPSRKLVAKLELEVEDRLRSVSISEDGKVLAAATSSETKVFQFRQRPDSDRLSIRKLEVPSALASSGARHVKFSSNGKWLAVVGLENDVQIVRLAADPSKPKHIQILKRVVELERREPHTGAQSSFKKYERSIARLDFAPDSAVLACGDYSGHLDSWVLEGHEDLTAPALDVSKHDSKNGDSDDSSDDSSDDDDEICIFYGQHWTDNPVGKLLPKLESAPLVLSFRPSPTASSDAVNGNPGIHSTRHNPHAHSHELPKGQHLLWIMTAQHKMYEIDVLGGRLSDWSRRNPTSALPEDFHNVVDRVKDAVWDITTQRQRLWLFGSSWAFMLNVGTVLTELSRKKRKAEAQAEGTKRLKTTSGAGIKKPEDHQLALPEKGRRYVDGDWIDMTFGKTRNVDDDDVDMEEDEDDDQLRLTRTTSNSQPVEEGTKQHQWWCTFKYRPVLGVVPLEDDTVPEGERELEVVVVERPLWDVKKERK